MFGGKKCNPPPDRLPDMPVARTDAEEVKYLKALKCPSGANLRYTKSRPPIDTALMERGWSPEEVWLQDHIVICERCGVETAVCSARSGDQEPSSGVAVRSKPRPDRYLIAHRLIPIALFSHPSGTIRRLMGDGVAFGRELHEIAGMELKPQPRPASPITKSWRLPEDRFGLAAVVEFETPRAPGEVYYALAALSDGNASPVYYVCERSTSMENATMHYTAMLCGWTGTPAGKLIKHLNFGDLAEVGLKQFVDAVEARMADDEWTEDDFPMA
jgi:hypothetical protein